MCASKYVCTEIFSQNEIYCLYLLLNMAVKYALIKALKLKILN